MTASGEPLLIMGNVKTGSIERFGVLRNYHDRFAALLNQTNARLMVIGYSFQDAHINSVIELAWRQHGLGTYLVDPRGRDVLIDPKEARAAIRPKPDIEDIKLLHPDPGFGHRSSAWWCAWKRQFRRQLT